MLLQAKQLSAHRTRSCSHFRRLWERSPILIHASYFSYIKNSVSLNRKYWHAVFPIHRNAGCVHGHHAEPSAMARQLCGFWWWAAQEGDCWQKIKSRGISTPVHNTSQHIGTPVNSKAVVAYAFCTALNDCNIQMKQWFRPPQKPSYELSLSASWPVAHTGDLFSPGKETFPSHQVSLLPSLSASHMLIES